MAKGSQFWGNASGKLGEQVLYRAGGEQRARTYVKNIKNPKTLAQAKQRLSMRNFANVFKAYADVVRLSFPNRPTKESGFNAFIKANKSAKSVALSKIQQQSGFFVPTDLVMSDGSLQLPRYQLLQSAEGTEPATFEFDAVEPKLIVPDTYESLLATMGLSADEIATTTTVTKVVSGAAAISAMLELVGLPGGCGLTMLAATYEDDGWKRSQIAPTTSVRWDGTSLTITIATSLYLGVEDDQYYFCLFASRKVSGSYEVSRSKFMSVGGNTDFAEQWLEGSSMYQEIMNDYVQDNEVITTNV